ncbi:hypothetical protein HY407_04055 [Candidatus Gottesmanbacteria bacterium]|nr:hypothetical protein [Candidatus Gottesmanbacteria bacterium]
MKNQTNITDQNIQQTVQDSPVLPSRKVNYWMVSSIVLVALFSVVTAIFFLKLYGQKSIENGSKNTTASTKSDTELSLNDESANWKTYSSDILTFRYPPEWIRRPIQVYPGTDSIIQFEITQDQSPFLTVDLIPYDSLRLTDSQKTLDSLVITNKNQYESVTISNHKGKKLYDPTGERGVSLPSVRVVLDVPEKSTFVDIGFNNPLPSVGFQTIVSKWFDPLISSLRFGVEEPRFEGTLLSYVVPTEWVIYNKQFQGLQFKFLYPNDCKIQDSDESSGSISIFCPSNQTGESVMSISRMKSSTKSSLDFEGGSQKEWFINNLIDNWPSSERFNRSKIAFEEARFQNGNSYLLVKDSGNGGGSSLYGNNSDYYFSIFNNKGVEIYDNKKLSKEEVYRIMQTLTVK